MDTDTAMRSARLAAETSNRPTVGSDALLALLAEIEAQRAAAWRWEVIAHCSMIERLDAATAGRLRDRVGVLLADLMASAPAAPESSREPSRTPAGPTGGTRSRTGPARGAEAI